MITGTYSDICNSKTGYCNNYEANISQLDGVIITSHQFFKNKIMRLLTQFFKSTTLTAMLCTGFAAGSMAQESSTIVNPETKAPVILSTTPTDGEQNVDLSSVFEITFNSEMDESTINETTLQLNASSENLSHEMHGEMMDERSGDRSETHNSDNRMHGTNGSVNGTISYSDNVAVFTPEEELKEGTQYTFTVTNGVKSSENIALENDQEWSFTTRGTSGSAYSVNQNGTYGTDRYGLDSNEYSSESTADTSLKSKTNMIDLGKAGQFVILAITDIHNESGSDITGQTGEGTLADKNEKERAFTDSARQNTSNRVAVWQSDQSDTTSSDVNEAIEDMMSAYGNVSSQNGDNDTSHENESIQGSELAPGVHEWSNSLHLESDVTLSGGEDDVWIFKVGDNLTVDENTVVTLTDGASADNVFWYVEGEVTIGRDAHFEGIILSMNEITLEKGAKLNGRLFSQSSITLDENTVTEPRGLASQTTSTNR
jgi:hypothetical protein